MSKKHLLLWMLALAPTQLLGYSSSHHLCTAKLDDKDSDWIVHFRMGHFNPKGNHANISIFGQRKDFPSHYPLIYWGSHHASRWEGELAMKGLRVDGKHQLIIPFEKKSKNPLRMLVPMEYRGKKLFFNCARERNLLEFALIDIDKMDFNPTNEINDPSRTIGTTSRPLEYGNFECKGFEENIGEGYKARYLIKEFNSDKDVFEVETEIYTDKGKLHASRAIEMNVNPKGTAWRGTALRIENPNARTHLTVSHFFGGRYSYTRLACNVTQ